jgi:hypothetical protein
VPPLHAEVAQDFALRLKQKIGGYQADLGSAAQIVVLALDSATPGRMSMTYYRELASSEFLQRLERWHTECAWFQNFEKNRKFFGAASPKDIATCAYGTRRQAYRGDISPFASLHHRKCPATKGHRRKLHTTCHGPHEHGPLGMGEMPRHRMLSLPKTTKRSQPTPTYHGTRT